MNMRDGCLLCVGKGNEEWNFSAPHGAGRRMSRAETRRSFTLSQYKKEMKGIYTTSVSRETLDEFIDVMRTIAREAIEDPELVKTAPHDTPVSRPDDTQAALTPKVTFFDL